MTAAGHVPAMPINGCEDRIRVESGHWPEVSNCPPMAHLAWMPLAYPPGEEARKAIATLQRYTEEAGRDPAIIGVDTQVSAGARGETEVRLWKSLVVTHLTLANYYESGQLHRIAGRSLSDHIAAMRRYWNAIADLL